MALLKRKHYSDCSQSRKSSMNSVSSSSNNSGAKHNIYSNNNATPSISVTEDNSSNMAIHTNNSPLSPNNNNNGQSITRNGSRLSSAPISGSSGNKRFSLSLRSFSSNSSLNHKGNNSKEEIAFKNTPNSNEKNDLSAVSSPAAITDSKLIFDWDVTDPKAWSWQRVVIWLQVNEFNLKWISFFRRSQISGNDFLKLMAKDNFAKIEKYLPSAQNSSYERFQHLLKRTMEHNVIYQQHSHSRSVSSLDSSYSKKSGYSKHLRTGSDQVSIGSNLKNMSNDKLAELSEGEETDDQARAAELSRSTIKVSDANSITSSSTNTMVASTTPISSGKLSVPTLNIPVPPTERKQKAKSDQKNDAFSTLYRRSFISIKGNGNEENSTNNIEPSRNNINTKLTRTRSSSKKSSPVTSPGTSTYAFLKKYHKSTPSDLSCSPITPNSLQTTKSKLIEIDAKYLPKKKPNLSTAENSLKEKYIFCTKDKQSFIPINVTYANDVATFKAALATNNNINHKNYSIFLINYMFDIAETPLDDDVIKSIMESDYKNGLDLFFIKNHLKIQLNRNRSNSSILSQPRKMSLKSTISKTSVGSSDLDEVDNGIKYPKTPSYLYENALAQDYISTAKPRSKRSTVSNPSSTSINNSDQNSTSFKIIRPDITNKIDFNQKRETPFVRLNPTRDAPPPPSPSVSGDMVPIPLPEMPGQKKDLKTPHRPPPPNMVLDETNKNIVSTTNPPRPNFSRKPSSLSLKNRPSNASLTKMENGHSRLSRSNSSIQSSIFTSPPRLLKRHSSRRIVSSALAGGDTFDENKISFCDAPAFSDSTDSDKSADSGEIKFVDTKNVTTNSFENFDDTIKDNIDSFLFKDVEHVTEEEDNDSDDSGIAWIKKDDEENIVHNSAKKGLLEEEISSDDSASKQIKGNTSSDSELGIIWTNNRVTQTTEHNIINNATASGFHSLLDDEFIEDECVHQSNHTEEDKNGFSFDSDSILGSLVNEIEDGTNDKNASNLKRKMTLRPSADLVYENLEVYFPGTDLDKPIFEGLTPPGSPQIVADSKFSKSNGSNSSSVGSNNIRQKSIVEASTIKHSSERDDYTFSSSNSTPQTSTNSNHRHQLPKRTKTLRILAKEALEVRNKKQKTKTNFDNTTLRRNDTTKLWGTKVIEITDKEKVVAINKNRNSKGQYREFAWIKGEVIGKGSFGCVYLGMNLTTAEMIAVKQVESSTDTQIEALRSEMETLKDLDHLNIVQYLGFEAKNNVYSLFLEYVAGGSVGALIRMFGRFSDVLIRFLNQQVLQGLSYLHNLGILHRDMKADNLLLDLDGVCKISDFGISKKSNDIYSNSEMTMTGTIFWMAPEMVDIKQGYSAKVDIWSLGCIVLEMFAGKRPWSNLEVVAAMFKIGKYKSAPPIPKDTLPLISEEGIKFLELCFQIDPEERPTADFLLENKVFPADPDFKFADTKLAKFTNQNHKTMTLPKDSE